jgi:hypothetical protein
MLRLVSVGFARWFVVAVVGDRLRGSFVRPGGHVSGIPERAELIGFNSVGRGVDEGSGQYVELREQRSRQLCNDAYQLTECKV